MRTVLTIVWCSIWRNRRRTLISMSAVGIGLRLIIAHSGILAGALSDATSSSIAWAWGTWRSPPAAGVLATARPRPSSRRRRSSRAVTNLADPSTLAIPVAEYWAKQNVIVRVGGYAPIGSSRNAGPLQSLTVSDVLAGSPAFVAGRVVTWFAQRVRRVALGRVCEGGHLLLSHAESWTAFCAMPIDFMNYRPLPSWAGQAVWARVS